MHYYHVTKKSNNKKTGPIAVTTTSSDSCPSSCPLSKSGCYANGGPLGIHWHKVDLGRGHNNIQSFKEELDGSLRPGNLIRHNQAGDLPGIENIDEGQLAELSAAFVPFKVFTYTHKYSPSDIDIIKKYNKSNFTINLSSNNLQHADLLMKTGLPVTTLLDKNETRKSFKTKNNNLVVTCPATIGDKIQCISCGNGNPLCARSDRKYIIGFPAHGSAKNIVSKIAKEENE